MQVKAKHIRPGDVIGGEKVQWAVPNYIREGKTEVKFAGRHGVFFKNEQMVEVERTS